MILASVSGSVGTRAGASSCILQPRAGRSGQDDVEVPPDKRAPVEMIEPELLFQFFVLLLDRPAMMRETHERVQRRRH